LSHSSQTPPTRNAEPKPNDSERTRAGETSAWVDRKAGVKMPPTKYDRSSATMAIGRFGATENSSRHGPTPIRLRPAHSSGLPMPRANHLPV
jgi:hypothetical protein